jgi:hypothetical protein
MRTALLAACVAVCPVARAAQIEYALDLPANQRLSYEVEFEVAFPGRVTLEAEWSPMRVLVLRLDGPGEKAMRRSGNSPQRFDLDIAPEQIVKDSPWKLTISGLAMREAAAGRLRIQLPDSPRATAKQNETGRQAPLPRPDPWTLPVRTPAGLDHGQLRFHRSTEQFREHVVGAGAPDTYRWQDGMLRFLAERRDRLTTAGSPIQPATRMMLERVVDVVRILDDLSELDTQPLNGPAPTDSLGQRAWKTVRHPRFAQVDSELDTLLTDLYGGHAPELEPELWFTNFLTCLIVCERNFEERALLGAERASNGELVRQQWATVVAAVDALNALRELP